MAERTERDQQRLDSPVCFALAIDPQTHTTLYAGTIGGVLRVLMAGELERDQ